MWRVAWGREDHVDARRRLRRRDAFNESMYGSVWVGGERAARLVRLCESLFSFCVF